jgi:hypothetical protein
MAGGGRNFICTVISASNIVYLQSLVDQENNNNKYYDHQAPKKAHSHMIFINSYPRQNSWHGSVFWQILAWVTNITEGL